MSVITRYILIKLLFSRLAIKVKPTMLIADLDISAYAKAVFHESKIYTVGQAIESYCLRQEIKGVGQKTWDDLLNSVC